MVSIEFGPGWTALGAGLAVGLAALGTAWAQSSIGAAAMGMMAEKDGKEGNALIMLALPETIIILGFVIAFFLVQKIV